MSGDGDSGQLPEYLTTDNWRLTTDEYIMEVKMGIYCHFRPTEEEEAEKIRENPELSFSMFFKSLDEEQDGIYDIDKAWDDLHFMLTGKSIYDPPESILEKAIMGGEKIGDPLDYGPPRWLNPSEVAEILNALNEISEEDLRKRINEDFIAAYYPNKWGYEDRFRDYFCWAFRSMKEYYKLAADKGQGLMIALS